MNQLSRIFALTLACIIVAGALSANTHAWTLDADASVVSFVSIKKGNIGESHVFTDISGTLTDTSAMVTIKADSVDSRVPIRDERMREFLFKTELYPTIEISADVSEIIAAISPGESELVELPAQIKLHGVSKELTIKARLSMLNDTVLLVSSSQPVIVRAADFNMVEGITKLASLVNNLPIAESVPVSFSLAFVAK